MTHKRARLSGSIAVLGFLAACGGGSTSPSGNGGVTVVVKDGGTTGTSGATITITGAGVSTANVSVSVGQTVTFVNNDNRPHEMASNPHPQHGSCPSLEAGLGTIAAGQTKVTHAFANTGTCGFHDHQQDSNTALQGSITVR
jgi:plastocyanin